METVWIIGGGRFGLRAARYLLKQDKAFQVVLVDRDQKKLEMFKLLSQLRFKDFSSLVIQSHQLGPGVGGYGPGALFSLIERMEVQKDPFLLITACRCHAVITGFNRKG